MSQQRHTQTTTVADQGQTCPICFEEFVLTNEKKPPPQHQQQQQEQEKEDAVVLVTSESDDDNDNQQQQHQQPTPFPLTACHHTFCVPCLVTHVMHSVETKRMPLVCPQVGCRAEIAKDTLVALVRKHDGKENPVGSSSSSSSSSSSGRMNKIVQQVERLTELAKNTDKIPCTKCDTLIQPHTSSSPSSTNKSDVLTCPACAHVFCRWHGDMHPHLSCAAFLQSDAGQQWQQSERVLRRFTKPCSRCGALLQKAAGCDYVVCGHCRGDMCWHCATHQHLQGETFRRCTQCRSTYHNQVRLPAIVACFLMIVIMVFTLTLIVVWPAVAAVFVLASGCCGGCFQCGRRLDSTTKSSSPSQGRDDPSSSPSQQQQQHPYRPVRGILAVVVILFLPLAMLLDGAIMMVRGTEEGFLDRLLPGLSGKVDEIPTLELSTASTPRTVLTMAENEEDDREADLEQGLVGPRSGDDDDDDDDDEHGMPDGS